MEDKEYTITLKVKESKIMNIPLDELAMALGMMAIHKIVESKSIL